MARPKRIPGYLHHKQRGRARVLINGKYIQLPGKYGSKESKDAYRRIVDEHLAAQQQAEIIRGDCLVVELMLQYLRHADKYYKSSEPNMIRRALKPLREMYGRLQADGITPLKLDAVRQHMMRECKWSRQGINKAINRIRRMFRWGVANELVRPATYQALTAVEPLKYDRCEAPESAYSQKQLTVSNDDITAIEPYVLPEVWAMVQLQRATGMRPGEICDLTWGEIDRSDSEVWIYTPT